MKRGEVWTVSGGKDFAGKPHAAVIVQDDRFDATDSITICAFTTVPKVKMGSHVGRLDDNDMVRLNQAMMVFLGMALSPNQKRKRDVSIRASTLPCLTRHPNSADSR